MANSILQGNMPFDRSIYSKADVDKIVEEHSHYIVSPAGSTYIRPTDEGNGVIDRTIEVNKYLSITFGADPTTGKATIDGFIPAHDDVPKEVVWSWTAPDAPAGGNYVMDLVGPFTSKDGSQVYVPSTSPVHDGFDPEAFYANLWGEIVEETSPIRLSFESGTEIRSWRPSFLIPINSNVSYDFSSVDITSDWSLVCPDDGLPGDYGHPCLRIRRVDGHLELYISDPLASFSIEDDGTLVQTGTFQIYPPAGKPVPSVEMIGAGTFAIRYKNFPQWFTFDERGSFEGNNAEMAEGSCQGVYYEDTPSEVISDRRVIATLDDITEVVGVKYATQSPLGESEPVDGVVTVFHMPSGVAAGSYGEESDRTVAPGESFVVAKNGVNATGHVTEESEVSITLDVSAGNVMMGYDSNDRTVSEVIEEIQEEIGGGGGGSITERLDRLDAEVADLSNDLSGLSNDVDSRLDDLSNDLATHEHSYIVNGSTRVQANDDGTASIVSPEGQKRTIATLNDLDRLEDDIQSKMDDLSNDIGGMVDARISDVEGKIDDLSNDLGTRMDGIDARIDDLSNDIVEVIDAKLTEIEGRIDDLSNDVNSRLDDLSNDIGEVIDTKLTEIEGKIDDLSNDVSLRAMDDNVVHKTGPLVEGQTIEVPIGIQTGSTELVEASGLGITTPSLPDIGKPEIRTWFWGNDEGTDPDTGDTVEGRLGAGIDLRLSPNDRRVVELVREATWNGSRFVNSASIWYGENEIKIPEKSGTIALEEYMPVPSDNTPKMDGTASPGAGARASRWDHVHPSDSSKLDVADVVSKDISFIAAPLFVNYGAYHTGDIVRTSYDIAQCFSAAYFRAKKDMNTSVANYFNNGDWCNDSKRNEYWEALGDSATVNRGDIVSYKGDLYRVKSDTWLTNADYPGSFQSELDFYLEKISLDDVDKSYIKEEAYGSRATIGQSSLTLSLQGQAPLVPFTLAIPDGFKLYWENGSSPHEVVYSAPSGGTTISFSTPPVYDQSYERYVLVPDGYTFVDMDTMFRTDNLLWFDSADPNSDSWGLDVGSAHGAYGAYLGFDDFKSPNPTASYAQLGRTWANKVPAISRTAVSPVSKTVATEDQLPVPAVSAPLPDSGTASVGVSAKYAREDHQHPSDSRKVDQGVNDSMFIQPDGAVQVIPAVYLYSTDNGIDANGDSIVTYIQAGSDNGGVFCKLIANESLESDSVTVSGSMQLLYRIPVPGGTAYDTAVLFSADANFTRSSATSRSISISNVVTSGHDANGTEFSTTQTYRYIMNGSASIIDYTSTGGSFVINCGPLTWVSGGSNPNTTIDIPYKKTLASTKYVDDAISGISGTVISVNGESGIVVLDAGDIMMGYDSNDITIAEAIGGLDDRIGDIDSVLDAINGEVI